MTQPVNGPYTTGAEAASAASEREVLKALVATLTPEVRARTCFCEPVAQGRLHLRGADCEAGEQRG